MIRRFSELYNYRELMRNLVIRDLKIRYKNSVLGVLWSLLNPLLMTVVFTVVFTVMLPNYEVDNYAVFFLCGFLPWNFLSASLVGGTGSIINNSNLIKKVYFPREVLPISIVLSNLVNFALAMLVLFAVILVFRTRITAAVLMLPLVILGQVMFITGLALLLATANVFYRDTQHILEVVIQAWFFLTPIFYPITILPPDKAILGVTINVQLWLRRLNPMASLVASYQDVLYWGVPTGLDFLLRTLITCALVLVIGYAVFCRYSSVFGEEA
jgi:lipopolysaccharide transport system permease protein